MCSESTYYHMANSRVSPVVSIMQNCKSVLFFHQTQFLNYEPPSPPHRTVQVLGLCDPKLNQRHLPCWLLFCILLGCLPLLWPSLISRIFNRLFSLVSPSSSLLTLTTTCGWFPSQCHRLSPISTGSRFPYSTCANNFSWRPFQNVLFHLTKGTTTLLLFKPKIWNSFSLLYPLISFGSKPCPFYLQLHSKPCQLPPSQWHQPRPPTDPSCTHNCHHLLLASCLHSCQLVLYFMYSKMYIFSYFNTSEIGIHLTVDGTLKLYCFFFFFLSNFNISKTRVKILQSMVS